MQNPNQLMEILWQEDINLAASGAVALELAAGRRGPWTESTADLAFSPDISGCAIKALHCWSETGSAGLGTFTIAENPRSPWDVALFDADLENFHYWFPGNGLKIPNRATLGYNGPINVGAAENECAAWIDVPGYDNGMNFSAGEDWDDIIMVRPTSAARVAETASGFTDLCGRGVAYTGAQPAIANDPNISVQILDIYPEDAAGYMGPIIETPTCHLSFLGIPTQNVHYSMFDIFGAYPTFPASNPIRVGGVGVGAAVLTLSAFKLGITYGK